MHLAEAPQQLVNVACLLLFYGPSPGTGGTTRGIDSSVRQKVSSFWAVLGGEL